MMALIDTIETSHKALLYPIPVRPIELEPHIYDFKSALEKSWQGQSFPMTDYIESDMTPL